MALKSNANGNFRFGETNDEAISMLDLKMDLEMDADNSFDFSSQPLSCPPSCSSTAGSFSSASSHYDPFTPTSRTSTPQQPINFDSSFDTDSMMFDFTPPSSATSSYFPLDMKSTVTPDMLSHGLPSTPSRCNNLFETTLPFHDSLNFTPTQDIDACNFADVLGSSPFMLSTPTPPFNSNIPNCDPASVWGQHTDGSPVTFSSPAMLMAMRTPTTLGSSHGNIRRRVAMDGPQQSSAMLQQHLQTPTKARVSKPRNAAGKSGAQGQRGYRVRKNVGTAESGKFRCDECIVKVYTRSEHLKRHKIGVHSKHPPTWNCEFCDKTFVGRGDNYKDHLKRHAQKTAGSRTRQNDGAAAVIAKLESKMKPRKRRGVKAESAAMTRPMKDVKTEVLNSPLSSPSL